MTGPGPSGRTLADALQGSLASIPDEVLASARLHLLDALAVGAVAARRGPVRGVTGLAATGGAGSCSVLGSPVPTTAPVAALVNGSLIHSLEFDDTHVPSVMHGSSVVAPSALAAAEAVGATGDRMFRGFVLGWEFLIRIGLASPGRIQARGFQITSAAGAFAAATVSALVRGDDADVLANAVGIAGSQAGGTFAFLAEGDTVKAVQPGWAAHSGLLAVELASAGVSGPQHVFGGRYGFYSLYADDADAADRLEIEVGDLGSRWHLPEAAYKLVPCCHYIHPYVEALTSLLQDVRAEDVRSIHCHVPDGAAPVIAEPWAQRQHPAKAHDARWSLPYVLGMVLLNGRVSAGAFDGPSDAGIMWLADRMDFSVWEGSGFPERFPARMSVTLEDGTVRELSVDDVKGGRTRPIAAADVIDKARGNLQEAGMRDADAEALVQEIVDATEPDPGRIGQLLSRGQSHA
jgi:2-methylcitrate dehydratase PrpD